MTDAPPEQKAAESSYTHAQLHGQACIVCGGEDGPLERSGYVEVETRPGVVLPWVVVAHPRHGGVES